MKKKIIAMAMLMALSLTSLAACGKSGSQSNPNAKYKVGVCQLVQHAALDAATEGFTAALKDELGDEVSVEVQNASGDSATCATICNTFVSEGVDLIMGNATPALVSASQATASIPIVGTSITDYATALDISDWNGKTGINVTGASDLAPLDKQAELLKELFPDAKKVGIVYCTAEANSKYQSTEITKTLKSMGYEVTEFTFSDSNDIQSVVTNACSNSDVLYIPTDNQAAAATETINNVALAAKVPIVCGEEGICEGCGVATLSISYYDMGYNAGKMAAKILKEGADPSTMDIQYSNEFTKKYNADICKTLGITPPDGYVAIEASEE
ncbi:MAG: ABC transporter substrate-binding protein [Lachnospiraceae bacterium]|nr:ABC transporter substrate-binding protein [Lachnospiraceae bacterium]MBO6153870.1 ABC transporter substrate-binding protein [Lachnospiraceae bacterium]MBQ2089440.1 ABC transporter substrate-binding protein [Lachnospiraceae bacterium]MBQ4300766.1 ABC transporter substrate-binding protein [Lachnospiraceae bacterium]